MPDGRRRRAAASVAAELASVSDVQAVLDTLMSAGLRELDAERLILCAVDRDGDRLVPIGASNMQIEILVRIGELTLDRSFPLAVAARSGEPVWVGSRAEAAVRFPALLPALQTGRAWCAIPLVSRGPVFAVVGVVFAAEEDFDEPDRMFISTVVHMAGLVLVGQLANGVVPGVVARRRDVRGDGRQVPSRVTVCAWARLVKVDGEWLTLEDFLTDRLHIEVTHGVHPSIADDVVAGKPVTIQIPVLPLTVEALDLDPSQFRHTPTVTSN